MKRRNYIPCDDIDGQQCLDGLKNTVRVSSNVVSSDLPKCQNQRFFVGLHKIDLTKYDRVIENRTFKYER